MKSPFFLELDDGLALHADQVRRYGGSGGIRDLSLLQSALGMPRASFGGQFLHTSIYEMAAAYLFHLVQNHPFIDGNKRIGLVTTIAFLGLNDLWLDCDSVELTEFVLGVARGELQKADIAVFLREHCQAST